MDSELLVKSIGYFPDYTSALLRTLLRFFLGQPLSKQLYTDASCCIVKLPDELALVTRNA